jgi:hypothetical protein
MAATVMAPPPAFACRDLLGVHALVTALIVQPPPAHRALRRMLVLHGEHPSELTRSASAQLVTLTTHSGRIVAKPLFSTDVHHSTQEAPCCVGFAASHRSCSKRWHAAAQSLPAGGWGVTAGRQHGDVRPMHPTTNKMIARIIQPPAPRSQSRCRWQTI